MSKLTGRTFTCEKTGKQYTNQVTIKDMMKASGRSNGYVHQWIKLNVPDVDILYGQCWGSKYRVLTIDRIHADDFLQHSSERPFHTSAKRKYSTRKDADKRRGPYKKRKVAAGVVLPARKPGPKPKTVTVCIEVPTKLAGAIEKMGGNIQNVLQKETDCYCEILKAELLEFVTE